MEKYNIYELFLPEIKNILLLRYSKFWSPQFSYLSFIMALLHNSQPISPDGSYIYPIPNYCFTILASAEEEPIVILFAKSI